jgi:hypothetical protein
MGALGIAAGAFAQNYAAARGLKSRLDSEKQQQEMNDIKIKRERDFDSAQQELSALHKNFLDTNYDFVNNKPFEQPQGGIADPSTPRPPSDPYTDSTRVKAYYDRVTPLLERQAFASGKDFLGVRKQVDDLRKGQYIERVGSALSRIEAGDEGGIKQLQAVYDMYPDGRKITGGKINEDGTVLLQYEVDGKPGERTVSKEQLLNYGKLALNPADAVKLRFQLTESQKDRDFRRNERVEGQQFTTSERVAGQEFKAGESQADRDWRTGEGDKDRNVKVSEGAADRANRSAISAADNRTRESIADKQIAADAPNREARVSENRTQNEIRQQQFYDNYFQVDSKFAPKPESELKNLFGDAKAAYERDLARWTAGTKLSRAAKTFSALNPDIPMATIGNITRQLEKGKLDVNEENGTGRRFVKHQNKRVYLD